MPTLEEDRKKLDNMLPEELRAAYKDFCKVPVEVALSGENRGHETIQSHFLAWKKGTQQNVIYDWFHQRGITEWDVKRGEGSEREHGDLLINTSGRWSIWAGPGWVQREGSPPPLLTYTKIGRDEYGEYWRPVPEKSGN